MPGVNVSISVNADFDITISFFALRRSIAFFCSLTVSGLIKSKMCLTITRVTIKENVIALKRIVHQFCCFDSNSHG